ncbi:MAG: hypothetical protein KJO07_18905, partial [Deltaproteobacteria bacterium]|nr:hypothetical protein [Deltaproteobacteria bacterium]
MKRFAALIALTTLAASGCVQNNEPEDAVREALPLASDVRVNVPDEAGDQQAALGEVSEYYALTRGISREFNGGAGFTLLLVHVIVQFPPTTVSGDTYTWGPFSDALDPSDYRLVVTDNGDGTYDWSLDGQSKIDSSAGFITAVSGVAVEGAEPHRGSGSFTLNFDNMKILDPVEHADSNGGIVEVTYDLENRDGTQASIDMHIETTDDDANEIVADYRYAENQDRSGDFQFSLPTDVDEDGSLLEDVVLRSRWLSDGSGRSDARVSGGDLGSDVAEVSQCWGTDFRTVFETASIPDLLVEAGDEADCAF